MKGKVATMMKIHTMIPGDDACIMSGLNLATSMIIRGLRANERGTTLYHGQGKLPRKNKAQVRFDLKLKGHKDLCHKLLGLFLTSMMQQPLHHGSVLELLHGLSQLSPDKRQQVYKKPSEKTG